MFFEYLFEPSVHNDKSEDEWMQDYHKERELRELEERIKESGFREYCQVLDELNERTKAIMSIYEDTPR